jgi:hypothetical protein
MESENWTEIDRKTNNMDLKENPYHGSLAVGAQRNAVSSG